MTENAGPSEARVRELLAEMRAERQRAMYVRLGGTLIILIILGVFAFKSYNRMKNFDVDTFMVTLQTEGAERVWPVISEELDAVAAKASPALEQAFQAEMMELGPRLQETLTEESEKLVNNMQERLANSLDENLKEKDLAKEAGLADRFPDYADNPEAMQELNEQLLRATREWANVQLDTTFAEHFKLLESINTTYHQLEGEAREGIEGGTSTASTEDVLTVFMEILNMRLNPEE